MLDIISIKTINSIIKYDSLIRISPKAIVSYIQCLTYHFEDLEPYRENLKGFDIRLSVFNKKSMSNFEELQKSGLVKINKDSVTFIDYWSKYIDKSKLILNDTSEVLLNSNYKDASFFKDELLNSGSFLELCLMKYKLSKENLFYLLNLYFKQQEVTKKKFFSYQELSTNCLYFIDRERKNLKNNKIVKLIDDRNEVHDLIKSKYRNNG